MDDANDETINTPEILEEVQTETQLIPTDIDFSSISTLASIKEIIYKIIHKANINNDIFKFDQYKKYFGVLERAEHAYEWLKANRDTATDNDFNEKVKHVEHGTNIKHLIAKDVHFFKKYEKRKRNKLRKKCCK